MHRRRVVVALALAMVLAPPALRAGEDPERLGYYMPVKPPATFKDVRYIALLDGPQYGVPGYGWVAIGTDDNHRRHRRFRIPTQPIRAEEVSFSTKTLNGVSYTFRGQFVDRPKPIEKDSDRDRVILVGTLARIRDKAVVAEASLRFSYTPGD